jgi:hypothetical protein
MIGPSFGTGCRFVRPSGSGFGSRCSVSADRPVSAAFLAFDAPKLSSVDPWALALSVAAAIAIFRFKVGMIPALVGCCAAGVVLFLVGALA